MQVQHTRLDNAGIYLFGGICKNTQDGQKIVFYRLDLDEKNTDIYVLDVTSNEAVQLTDSPGLDTVPLFSPDRVLCISTQKYTLGILVRNPG